MLRVLFLLYVEFAERLVFYSVLVSIVIYFTSVLGYGSLIALLMSLLFLGISYLAEAFIDAIGAATGMHTVIVIFSSFVILIGKISLRVKKYCLKIQSTFYLHHFTINSSINRKKQMSKTKGLNGECA